MADEIKFSEEELQSLSDLSTNYQNIQSSFGQLRVQKILNQQQADALEEAEVKMEIIVIMRSLKIQILMTIMTTMKSQNMAKLNIGTKDIHNIHHLTG